MAMHRFTTITLLLLGHLVDALVLKHDVGRVPALGWNSWNAYHCNVSEANLLVAANAMIKHGLKDAGYVYVNSDDCWSDQRGRDPMTHRIVPNATTFPDGINGTAAKLHAMGLKMGIYSSAGNKTCAGYPASLGYEDVDAETFAEWGVDYLKYDNCHIPQIPVNWTDRYVACVPDNTTYENAANNGSCSTAISASQLAPPGFDWSSSKTHERYVRMRDALLRQNRTILYSLCEWGTAGVLSWGNSTGNSWRTTGDVTPYWSRVAQILNENSFYTHSTNFWGHNDADMLEVGNGNLTTQETRSHFAFWAAMKGPLLIGTNLTNLSATNVDILKNKYLLAFNQDPTIGAPATPYKWGVNPDWTFDPVHPAEYWSGNFHYQGSSKTLILMLNTEDQKAQRKAVWSDIPQLKGRGNAFEVWNAWTGRSYRCMSGGAPVTLEPHDTSVLVVGKPC